MSTIPAWEMGDGLTDPMDNGHMALAPGAFDPLCELRGEPYPRDATDHDPCIEVQRWDACELNEVVA